MKLNEPILSSPAVPSEALFVDWAEPSLRHHRCHHNCRRQRRTRASCESPLGRYVWPATYVLSVNDLNTYIVCNKKNGSEFTFGAFSPERSP